MQNDLTALILVAEKGCADVVQMLLDAGAGVNAADKVWSDVVMS